MRRVREKKIDWFGAYIFFLLLFFYSISFRSFPPHYYYFILFVHLFCFFFFFSVLCIFFFFLLKENIKTQHKAKMLWDTNKTSIYIYTHASSSGLVVAVVDDSFSLSLHFVHSAANTQTHVDTLTEKNVLSPKYFFACFLLLLLLLCSLSSYNLSCSVRSRSSVSAKSINQYGSICTYQIFTIYILVSYQYDIFYWTIVIIIILTHSHHI